eukprot:4837635-Amphidinium_carterae.2
MDDTQLVEDQWSKGWGVRIYGVEQGGLRKIELLLSGLILILYVVQEGLVVHTVGWPLDQWTYGGGFIYHMKGNLVHLGSLAAGNPHSTNICGLAYFV